MGGGVAIVDDRRPLNQNWNIGPTPWTWTGTPARSKIPAIPAISRSDSSNRRSWVPGRARTSSEALVAAVATAFALYVPAWRTAPSETWSMMSRRPPSAATGKPPPSALAIVVRSGVTP